jgi:flagellin-specific chaperone FliS
MSQQFNVDFGRQGRGLPQPFQVGGQKQSLQERLVGAAQLKQARLNESRRRIERAQAIDRQDLQALAGYDAGQLADSFRPLFQQDVDEVRNFILESDDILEQQNMLAQLQATWNWMSEHNNETVQAARKAMKGVAFSEPNQQRAASSGLDVGLEFDESPQHFAEVEMQFNNFFDPSKAKKIDGVWMIEKDGEYVDIRELEGYGNAEVFTPRTKQVDVGLVSTWATGSDVQRVVNLDGEYSEERAREVFNQARMNNKTGKEHRAQILATLHQRGESPFLNPAQERAFIEGVPMDKDDEMFASAMAQALARGEEIFLSMVRSEPTPDQKDVAHDRFIESGESTQFVDDTGFNHNGTARSLVGFSDMVITDDSGNAIKVTPTHIFVDDNNQVFLEYASLSGTGDQMTHTVPLTGAMRSDIELQMRAKHNVSINELLTEMKEEGETGAGSLDNIGVTEEQAEEPVTTQDVDQPGQQASEGRVANVEPPSQPAVSIGNQPVIDLPADSPVVTIDSTTGGTSNRSGVFEAVASYEGLNMSRAELESFLSLPEVNEAMKALDLAPVSVGTDRPFLGAVLEGAFGWAGYKTRVTKNAEKIIEWMNSPEGMDARRKHALMSSPQQEVGDPMERVDANAEESSRVISSLPSDARDEVVQRINSALPQRLFAYETTNSMGEKAIGFLNEAGEDTGEMIFL